MSPLSAEPAVPVVLTVWPPGVIVTGPQCDRPLTLRTLVIAVIAVIVTVISEFLEVQVIIVMHDVFFLSLVVIGHSNTGVGRRMLARIKPCSRQIP